MQKTRAKSDVRIALRAHTVAVAALHMCGARETSLFMLRRASILTALRGSLSMYEHSSSSCTQGRRMRIRFVLAIKWNKKIENKECII